MNEKQNEIKSKLADINLRKAEDAVAQGNLEQAEIPLKTAERDSPKNANIKQVKTDIAIHLTQSASRHLESGDIDEAEEVLSRAEKLRPDINEVSECRDMLNREKKKKAEAKALGFLEEAKNGINSGKSIEEIEEALLNAEKILPENQEVESVRQEFELIKPELKKKEALVLVGEAQQALQEKKFDQAAKLIDNAENLDANIPAIKRIKGKVKNRLDFWMKETSKYKDEKEKLLMKLSTAQRQYNSQIKYRSQFTVAGKIKDSDNKALLIWGYAFSRDRYAPVEALCAEECNLLVLNYNKEFARRTGNTFYNGQHFFLGKYPGKGIFGQYVPVRMFGDEPKSPKEKMAKDSLSKVEKMVENKVAKYDQKLNIAVEKYLQEFPSDPLRLNNDESQKEVGKAERAAVLFSEVRGMEILEPGTNHIWLRCPLGQKWTGSSCTGEGRMLDWQSAMTACPTGYRLPAIEELKANKDNMFGQDSLWYWSSSGDAGSIGYAWSVFFGDGRVSLDDKSNTCYVRCVRNGP